MKNRSTDLIDWDESLTEGTGCTGTRYRLQVERWDDNRSLAENPGHLRIVVDGSPLSSARSFQDALARSEGFEALRCFLQGRTAQISDEHCRVAELVAGEMLEAVTEALDRSPPAEERRGLMQNFDTLRALSSALQAERLKRQRGNPVPPLLH